MPSNFNKYSETYKKRRNELAELHSGSESLYDVEGFLKGKNVLNDLELQEVGDVRGKLLLHLQCHFGTCFIFFFITKKVCFLQSSGSNSWH